MRVKRKSLIEERYHGMKRRQLNFIKTIQERALKMQTSWVPFLPNDLMFKIFILLPIKSLLRFTCVCKSWYKLINCAEFVEAYNSHAKTTPILLSSVEKDRLNTFNVETELHQLERFCLFPPGADDRRSKFIQMLDVQDGKGSIVDLNISCYGSVLSSCNGLLLIVSMHGPRMRYAGPSFEGFIGSEKPGRLIVMNPMTRKLIGFPLGTLAYGSHNESYGIVYSHLSGDYKVVHLFLDKERYVCCEILSVRTRSWKEIDGVPVELSTCMGRSPISGSGALHWNPGRHSDFVVSMGVDDEKFGFTNLPKAMGTHDRLVEIGGSLSFVNSIDMDHIEVWILKGLKESEWVKQHTINIDAVLGHVEIEEYSVPCFALNAKEMVFRRRKKLYSYDFELEEIKEIEMGGHGIKILPHEILLPHSNSLATWESLESMS